MSTHRLIPPKDLPNSLWHAGKNCIQLAPDLVLAWRHLLDHAGLYEKALEPIPGGKIGGLSKKETDEHLAWNFTGSSARVQLAVLDPHEKLSGVSDAFARVFSGGTVLVADLPCGSGAAVLTILSVVAELRRQACVPREPLHVKLVGGELSEFARSYADEATRHILSSLADQAIWVEPEFLPWDALNKIATADLIGTLYKRSADCSARMLVLANFSGFLQAEKNWDKASKQFEDLFLHCRDQHSFVIWIEPQTNTATTLLGGFFSRLLEWFKKQFGPLLPSESIVNYEMTKLGLADADVQHPLREEHQFKVNLAIQRFDLPQAGAKQ